MNTPFHLRRHAALSLAGMALAIAAPAMAITIDDFRSGPGVLEFPNTPVGADGWLRSDTAAAVPGGSRSLALQPLAGSTALVFIGPDRLGLEAYRVENQQLYTSFGYGQSAPMDLDLGSESALRLDLAWGGAYLGGGTWDADALTVTVYATTSNGAGLNPNGSAARAVLRGASVLDIPFSSFATNASTGVGVNWRDVDGLLFVVNEAVVGAQATGFGLRSLTTVSAVPEPSTAVMAGLGLAALCAWRRRRAVVA